ncbi:unnamed protein product [Brachionus calyciflorus]|uniref:Integrase catalytic domain-containing protein n=1 Tax=Brachionus calyciflorus TaxID=104777 RepID=A0A813ZZL9_9BILA|nr:unnamed protein product [Brachionus calyciflorus]
MDSCQKVGSVTEVANVEVESTEADVRKEEAEFCANENLLKKDIEIRETIDSITLSPNLEPEEAKTLKNLIFEYRDCFSWSENDIGKTQLIKHKINTGFSEPIKQPPFRVPAHIRQEIENEIKKMLKNKIIQESNSPWASPVVMVKKKNGKFQFCVDYRKLNKLTIKDSFPIPHVDDTLLALDGSRYFSLFDLIESYHQIDLQNGILVYLGFELTKDRLKPDPNTTQAIAKMKIPIDAEEVRRFLGSINFYRHFIAHFSQIAAPLYRLLGKKIKFVWDILCEEAFNELKNKLNKLKCLLKNKNQILLNNWAISQLKKIVGIDVVGPLPTTARDMKYIVVAICYFSKWCEALATIDFTKITTAKFIVNNLICRFDFLSKIITDQGPNFEANLLKELCKLLKIEKLRTTAYHPQCNGKVERQNRTLKSIVAKYVNSNHTDWDLYLSSTLFAYNTAVHSSTGKSPYEILFGRTEYGLNDVKFATEGSKSWSNEYLRNMEINTV